MAQGEPMTSPRGLWQRLLRQRRPISAGMAKLLGDRLEALRPPSREKLPGNEPTQRKAELKQGRRPSPKGLCKSLDLALPEAI